MTQLQSRNSQDEAKQIRPWAKDLCCPERYWVRSWLQEQVLTELSPADTMSLQEIPLFPNILISPSPHLPLQGSLILLGPPGLGVVTAIPV